jgi:hypothetical protein
MHKVAVHEHIGNELPDTEKLGIEIKGTQYIVKIQSGDHIFCRKEDHIDDQQILYYRRYMDIIHVSTCQIFCQTLSAPSSVSQACH